jgi:hypothetical protein
MGCQAAPIADFTLCNGSGGVKAAGSGQPAVRPIGHPAVEASDGAQVLLCGGRGRSGSLSRAAPGVRLVEREVWAGEACDAVFSVKGGAPTAEEEEGGDVAGRGEEHHSRLILVSSRKLDGKGRTSAGTLDAQWLGEVDLVAR